MAGSALDGIAKYIKEAKLDEKAAAALLQHIEHIVTDGEGLPKEAKEKDDAATARMFEGKIVEWLKDQNLISSE